MAHFKVLDSSSLPIDQVELQAPFGMGGAYQENGRDEKYARQAWEGEGEPPPPPPLQPAPKTRGLRRTSPLLKSFILGGINGLTFSSSIVAAIIGAGFPLEFVVIIGFSCLLGHSVYRCMNDCSTKRAYIQRFRSELAQRHSSTKGTADESDKSVLMELYRLKGVSHEDAMELCEIFSQTPSLFVQVLLIEESGLVDKNLKPFLSGISTLVSFAIFGSFPIWIYFGLTTVASTNLLRPQVFLICCCVSGGVLLVLGALKSLVCQQHWVLSALQTLFVGLLSGSAAFFIGFGLQFVFKELLLYPDDYLVVYRV